MIIEAIITSFGIIVVGAMILADRVLDRQRNKDMAPRVARSVGSEESVEILPFTETLIGLRCPKCAIKSKNAVFVVPSNPTLGIAYEPEGPTNPMACKDKACKARGWERLHASCDTCKASWFMKPADTK